MKMERLRAMPALKTSKQQTTAVNVKKRYRPTKDMRDYYFGIRHSKPEFRPMCLDCDTKGPNGMIKEVFGWSCLHCKAKRNKYMMPLNAEGELE